MKTELTKKMIKSCTSKDALKPALKGAYLDVDKKRLTTCNGVAVINYKVDVSPEDNSGILPVELFKNKISDRCEYSVNGVAIRNNFDSKSEYNLIDQKFPDVDSVTPEDDVEDRVVGINLDLLKQLCEGVPKDNNGNKYIELRIPKNCNKAIKFKQFNVDGISNYDGIMMPVRIDETTNKRS